MRQPAYRPDIDGLRALAILAVLGFHAFPGFVPGGFVGVDIFFVVSGYLISTIVLAELEQGTFTLATFYRRRVRRLFPALLLVLLCTLLAGWWLLFADEYGQLVRHTAAGTAFLSNFLLWHEIGYFDNAADTKPLLHLWSLAVEEQFYICWPPLLMLAWRKSWNRLRLVAGAGGLSLAISVALVGRDAGADFYWPVSRFWEPMLGALLACLPLPLPLSDPGRRLNNTQAALGCVLMLSGMVLLDRNTPYPGGWALLPTLGALLVILAGPEAWLNRHILSRRAVVLVGLVSYPLYLWHWPVLVFQRLVLGDVGGAWATLAALGISFGLAWLTYVLLEKRIRHAGSPHVVPALVLASAALLYLALMVFLQDGFPERPLNRYALLELGDRAKMAAWSSSRNSDGSCEAMLGLATLPAEVCQANTPAPRLLFAGDSHAMALHSAIDENTVHADAALMAGHSCLFYPQLEYVPARKEKGNMDCGAIARKVLAVARNMKSIDTVLLVSYYPVLDTRMSAYRLDGRDLTHTEAFMAGTAYMVQSLLDAGKKVVFVLDVPHLRIEPGSCAGRVPFVVPRECAYRAEEQQAIAHDYTRLLRELKERYPSLTVYDPTPLFCPGVMCRSRVDQHYLYTDSHHISLYGSQLLLDRMKDDGVLAF